jgi:hypothetical protein
MKLEINANIYDESTQKLAHALRPLISQLSERLSGDYGGPMEYLCIDIELLEYLSKPDGSPRYAFRLQKRVSGRGRLGLPAVPDRLNVGHYSVRPDFAFIASNSTSKSVAHVLAHVHISLQTLKAKQKKLGDFDVDLLIRRYSEVCKEIGVLIPGSR